MHITPKFSSTQYVPRAILDRQIWPVQITTELSPIEAATERLVHQTIVEAASPAWHRALAGALLGLRVTP